VQWHASNPQVVPVCAFVVFKDAANPYSTSNVLLTRYLPG
jgi:hypothetical protein